MGTRGIGAGKMSVNSFRNLRVWQATMELVAAIYDVTKTFQSHETYDLVSQMRRAAVSVPSNIAEGHTRESTKEYLQHVSMAQASLAELSTQMEIAARLGYARAPRVKEILDRLSALGRQALCAPQRAREASLP